MIHSHAALSAGAKSTQPRQVGLISKFLSLDFLHPRFSSRFAVFGIILMARFAALLLLAPAVLAFDYTVGVGKDETTGQLGMGFDPSSVRPQAGDRIVFEFRAGSHSAVESTFTDPCTPKPGGFDSGVVTVADGTPVDASGLPTKEYIVKDTNPVWFFDQAGGLCSKGAVFSINPELTGDQTAGQFRANAEATNPNPTPETSTSPTSAAASSTGSAPVGSTSAGSTSTGGASATSTSARASTTSSTPNGAGQMTSFSIGASLAALGAWLFI
ncbi:hypothetical protein CTheo_2450 [Ceratobasidium theobromae]|uniref:Uncharacterized protein n=1 Tax=Ceratobasidium theobromae TaxID=1582974 RepID=A0A5N5QRC7_9AGAM|nr:hypothetical protein CTheo_2450 [Ceratobasidium theobromae]